MNIQNCFCLIPLYTEMSANGAVVKSCPQHFVLLPLYHTCSGYSRGDSNFQLTRWSNCAIVPPSRVKPPVLRHSGGSSSLGGTVSPVDNSDSKAKGRPLGWHGLCCFPSALRQCDGGERTFTNRHAKEPIGSYPTSDHRGSGLCCTFSQAGLRSRSGGVGAAPDFAAQAPGQLVLDRKPTTC
jgi:hypothetical protein